MRQFVTKEVSMPLYHATWADNVASILKFGLGGASPAKRNFPSAVQGVYLTTHPAIGLSFLLESLLNRDDLDNTSPEEFLGNVRVFVIDDARIDESLLDYDPEVERRDVTRFYRGIINVTGMPVLTIEQLGFVELPTELKPVIRHHP